MCHHLFRLIVSIACRCFRSNAAALAATVAAILSLPLPAVEAEPGLLRASWSFFPVCAAFFLRSSFVLLFLSAAFEN
jgi:hypothetical protein